MKALSLTQPWPWIILHLGKRIENRSRNIGNHQGPLLLHAAKRMSSTDWWSAYDFVHKRLGQAPADSIPSPFPAGFDRAFTMTSLDHPALPRGAIVAQCNVVGQWDRRTGLTQLSLYPDEWLDQQWLEQRQRWYMDAHAYVLSDVRAIATPVPCKGALGFWNVPDAVLQQVLAT